MSGVGEHNSPLLREFAEAASRLETVQCARELAAHSFNARVNPLGFGVSSDADRRNDSSFDALVDKHHIFVHKTYPEEAQQNGEAILEAAGLLMLPVAFTNESLTMRVVPGESLRLIDFAPDIPTAKTIGRSFLAPVLRQLFDRSAKVPSTETVARLTTVQSVKRVQGSDTTQSSIFFVPPYQFMEVDPDSFVRIAAENSAQFGKRTQQALIDELQDIR